MSDAFAAARAALFKALNSASHAVQFRHGSAALHDAAAETALAFGAWAKELEAIAAAARSRPAKRPAQVPAEDAPKPREQIEERTPLSILEIAELEYGDHGKPRPEIVELAALLKTAPLQDAAAALQSRIHDACQHTQVMCYRALVRYIWHNSRNPWEMMKRALSITRRYLKTEIRGISETEVSELLDEGRATTSAREIRVHDEQLIRWGVRAPNAPDGALKSPATKAAASKAAKGNNNRRKSAQKQRAAALLTTFQTSANPAPSPPP